MLTAILTIAALALLAGLVLSLAHRRLPADANELVEQVNDLLPQTQCAQCGYQGCRPYAAAVVNGDAAINLCPPGGDATVERLARLLGRDMLPVAAQAWARGRTGASTGLARVVGAGRRRGVVSVGGHGARPGSRACERVRPDSGGLRSRTWWGQGGQSERRQHPQAPSRMRST